MPTATTPAETETATQTNPAGRYREGTILEITDAPIKSDNGRFVVGSPFPAQTRGDSYHSLRRLGRNGRVLSESNCHRNVRGNRASWLDRYARIVSEPTPEWSVRRFGVRAAIARLDVYEVARIEGAEVEGQVGAVVLVNGERVDRHEAAERLVA